MQLENTYKNNNEILIPKIMLGSFKVESQQIMDRMVDTAIGAKCYGFDTSPSYGTEVMLGKALKISQDKYNIKRNQLFISNKVDGWQMAESNGDIRKYVYESLKRVETDYFDLLLIHWPFEKYLKNTWKCMECLLKEGIVNTIGLSNMNVRTYEKFLQIFPEKEPSIIQNEISPLNVCEEDVYYFQKRGIQLEAYSPLCRMVPKIKDSRKLKEIAHKYGKSIPQLIIRWNVQRDIIPIFTSEKPERIIDNLQVFDFEISWEDMNEINAMNENYKIFPESFGCPGY